MTLRNKTVAVIAAGQLLGIAVLYVFFTSLLADGFIKIEENEEIRNVERAERALQERIDSITVKATDWANWDDTYKFIKDRNREFVKSNLLAEGLYSLNLNFLLFFDLKGGLVKGVGIDPEQQETIALPPELTSVFSGESGLLAQTGEDMEQRKGFVRLGAEYLMFGSLPIVQTSGDGPVRGSVVFGRLLSDFEKKNISAIANIDVSIQPLEKALLPSGEGVVERTSSSGKRVLLSRPNQDEIHSFSEVRDISGKEALVFQVRSKRSIFAQGQRTGKTLILLIAALGCLNALITSALLGRTVTRRLSRLHSEVGAVAGNKNASLRVTQEGRDEIGELAEGINGMLDALERYGADLKEARDVAQSASREKSMFVARMSHEVRSPVHGILGMLNIVLGFEMPETIKRYLGMAKSSADLLLTLVNDVLDFSKIEAGKLTLEDCEVELDQLLSQTFSTMALRTHEKGLELVNSISGSVPRTIIGDPVRLRQVLINLIGNAIKFTEKGEIEVSALLEKEQSGEELLHFSVRDTGTGISEEGVARVFQAYTQAEKSTTRTHGGTGLGLTISKQIVEAMNGRIWLESRLGVGTIFHFTVPLRRGLKEAVQQQIACTIDLAIPNKALRESVSERFMRMGAQVRECARIEDLPAAAPNVLLIVDSGYGAEAVSALLDVRKGAQKVLALLRTDQLALSDRLGKAGAWKVLSKPLLNCDIEHLLREFRGITELRPASRQGHVLRAERPLNILVADDTAVNRTIASLMLKDWGHNVICVENGKQAIDEIHGRREKESIDMLLLDVEMPVLNGFETARRIRAEEKPGVRLPIVALTAHSAQEELDKLKAAGVDGTVTKPIDAQNLFKLMESLVGGKAGQAAAAPAAAPETGSHPMIDALHGIAGRDVSAQFALQDLLKAFRWQEESVKEVLQAFTMEAEDLMSRVEDALRRSDASEVQRAAHAVKGSCRNIAARPAAEIAARIEEKGKDGEIGALEPAFKQLRNEMDHLLQWIPKIL